MNFGISRPNVPENDRAPINPRIIRLTNVAVKFTTATTFFLESFTDIPIKDKLAGNFGNITLPKILTNVNTAVTERLTFFVKTPRYDRLAACCFIGCLMYVATKPNEAFSNLGIVFADAPTKARIAAINFEMARACAPMNDKAAVITCANADVVVVTAIGSPVIEPKPSILVIRINTNFAAPARPSGASGSRATSAASTSAARSTAISTSTTCTGILPTTSAAALAHYYIMSISAIPADSGIRGPQRSSSSRCKVSTSAASCCAS